MVLKFKINSVREILIHLYIAAIEVSYGILKKTNNYNDIIQ